MVPRAFALRGTASSSHLDPICPFLPGVCHFCACILPYIGSPIQAHPLVLKRAHSLWHIPRALLLKLLPFRQRPPGAHNSGTSSFGPASSLSLKRLCLMVLLTSPLGPPLLLLVCELSLSLSLLFFILPHSWRPYVCPSCCSAVLLSHRLTAQNASHSTYPCRLLLIFIVMPQRVQLPANFRLDTSPYSSDSDCSISDHLEINYHFPVSDRLHCYCSIAADPPPDDVAPQFQPFSYDPDLDIAEQFRNNDMPGLLKCPPSSGPSRESSRESSPDFGLALPPALQRPPSPHLLDINEEDFMDQPVPPTPPPRRQMLRPRRPQPLQPDNPASPAMALQEQNQTPPRPQQLRSPAPVPPAPAMAPPMEPCQASPDLPQPNLRSPPPQRLGDTGSAPSPSRPEPEPYMPRRQLFPIVTLERLPHRPARSRSPVRPRSPMSASSSPPPLQIDSASPAPSPTTSPLPRCQAAPGGPSPGTSQPRPVVFLPLQTDLPTAIKAAREAVPTERVETSDDDATMPGPRTSPSQQPRTPPLPREDCSNTPAPAPPARQPLQNRFQPSLNIPSDVQRATDLHASFRHRLRQRMSPLHAFVPLSPGSPSLLSRVRPGCPPIHTRLTPAHQVAIRDTPPATSLDMSEELEWASNLDYFFLLSGTVQDYVIWRNNIVNLAQRRRWSAPFLVIVVTLSLRRLLPSFTLQMIGVPPHPSGFAFMAALDNFFISIRPNIPGEQHPGRTSAALYMGPPVPNVPVATLTGLQTRWIFRYRALPPASSFQRAHILLSYPPTQRELYLLTIRNFLHSVHNMVLNCFTPDSPSVARVAFPLQPSPLLPPLRTTTTAPDTSASNRSSSSDSEPPPLASTSSSDSADTPDARTHRHVQYIDDVLTVTVPNTPPQPLVSPIFATACVSALTSWAFVFLLRSIHQFSQQ